MEETATDFESSAIAKDQSNSNSSSGSVLTDRDDSLADHNGIRSPVRFARTVPEFPSSSPATTATATSSSLPKKSSNNTRRLVKKRTVTVPIAEVEGIKGPIGDCTPPPDAWTWRKYGQKPIKGSPYPRGYYRCSSSKGCPARKQVERNRVDPTVLVVTYASEHNHPLPAPRGHGHSTHGHGHGHNHRAGAGQSGNSRRPAAPVEEEEEEEKEEKEEVPTAPSPSIVNTGASSTEESTFTDLGDASSFMPMDGSDFCWFSGLVETPLPTTTMPFMDDDDAGMSLPMTCKDVGEDDALFAGLGELPECSVVFRRPSMSSTHGGARGSQQVQLNGYGAVL